MGNVHPVSGFLDTPVLSPPLFLAGRAPSFHSISALACRRTVHPSFPNTAPLVLSWYSPKLTGMEGGGREDAPRCSSTPLRFVLEVDVASSVEASRSFSRLDLSCEPVTLPSSSRSCLLPDSELQLSGHLLLETLARP